MLHSVLHCWATTAGHIAVEIYLRKCQWAKNKGMPNKPANSIGLRDKPMKITHDKLADRMAATTLLNTAEIRTQSCSHWHYSESSCLSPADPFLQCTNYFKLMKSYASIIRSTCWWQSEADVSCQLPTANCQLLPQRTK